MLYKIKLQASGVLYTHTHICMFKMYFLSPTYVIPYKTISQAGKTKLISCPVLQREANPEVLKYRKIMKLHRGSTVLNRALFSTL